MLIETSSANALFLRAGGLVRERGVRVESAHGTTLEVIGLELRTPLDDAARLPLDGPHPDECVVRAGFYRCLEVLCYEPGSRRAFAYVGEERVREVSEHYSTTEEARCLPAVQLLLRERLLHLFVWARSLDVEGEFPRDLAFLGRLGVEAAAYLARDLGEEVHAGDLVVYATSAHVYI